MLCAVVLAFVFDGVCAQQASQTIVRAHGCPASKLASFGNLLALWQAARFSFSRLRSAIAATSSGDRLRTRRVRTMPTLLSPE